MQTIDFTFDWSEMAFASKKPLKDLDAVFIPAPRDMSLARITQLIKEILPKSNLVIGISKDPYVDGLEGQLQFTMLRFNDGLQELMNKVNSAAARNKIYTLHYFQRESKFIMEKIPFRKILLVNGSWSNTFHAREEFYTLVKQSTDYAFISPFTDEAEALDYETKTTKRVIADVWPSDPSGPQTEIRMLALASRAAKLTFEHGFQTGATLGKRIGKSNKYIFLAHSFNKVVPFQTYAMLHGAEREKHFSPTNDLNYYDTVHAEVMLLVEAQKLRLDLSHSTLFINLMPCPHCARMLTQTDIEEFIYTIDHSDGYAVRMLEIAGKKVRRLVPDEQS